ncbi:cytochrome P450 [Mycobacterium haemophilum]|nr:cytochrome P450 [Mycobacterium haemophilum]
MTKTSPHASVLPRPRFRLPVMGDLLTLNFREPVMGTAREMDAYGGIVEKRIFNLRLIVISRTDLIDEVNDESRWEKHVGHVLLNMRSLAGDGLFTAFNDEPNWSKAHNILMPAFTKAAMASYHASMLDTAGELVSTWSQHAADGTWVDIPGEANRLTTEMVARAGLGYSFTKLSDTSESPFNTAFLRGLKYAIGKVRTDALPLYEQLLGRRGRNQHQRDTQYLREQVAAIIEARRNSDSRDDAAKDMLDIMLHETDPDTGERLDEANIVNQVMTLLIAGSETSANTIAFALHYLATNPGMAAAARAEVDQRWPDRDIPEVSFDDVAKLRYLRRIVDETLRLWPIAPGYFRQAKTDTTLGEGRYRFTAGDRVFVFLVAAHRDRPWGDDADQFNPDRFLPENIRKLPPRIYKPFGTGSRACIGRQFALHEILLTLAMILHQFTLEPYPGYQLQVSETVSLKPKDLRLRLHRRP